MTSLCVHASRSAVASSDLSLRQVRHRCFTLRSLSICPSLFYTHEHTIVTKDSDSSVWQLDHPSHYSLGGKSIEWYGIREVITVCRRLGACVGQGWWGGAQYLSIVKALAADNKWVASDYNARCAEMWRSLLQSTPSLPQWGSANPHVGLRSTAKRHYNSFFT